MIRPLPEYRLPNAFSPDLDQGPRPGGRCDVHPDEGAGRSHGAHHHRDLPIALFGGGGGTITTGRHIRVRSGLPLTNLYCSMLDRMGVSVDKFSDSNGRIDSLKV